VVVTKDIVFDESSFYKLNPVEMTFEPTNLSILFSSPLIEDEDELSKPAPDNNVHQTYQYTQDSSQTQQDNEDQKEDDPYHLGEPVLTQTPIENIMPYQSVMDDLEEWPTTDAFNDFDSFSANTDELIDLQELSLPVKGETTAAGYTTRSGHLSKISPWLSDNFVGLLTMPCEPQTYDEAIWDLDWTEAINKEKASIIKNQTWTLTKLPFGKIPISTKWLF
jgi:hypothetical protein